MAPKSRPLPERFWEKVDKNGPLHPYMPKLGRCWLWTFSTGRGGYGQICEGGRHGRVLRAHRVSYELHKGPIPKDLEIRHTCDNPPCVNPAHLLCGTGQDNVGDRNERGRQAKREKNGAVKLTEEQIAEIHRDYVYGSSTHGMPALGQKYNVDPSTIGYIVRGKTWK